MKHKLLSAGGRSAMMRKIFSVSGTSILVVTLVMTFTPLEIPYGFISCKKSLTGQAVCYGGLASTGGGANRHGGQGELRPLAMGERNSNFFSAEECAAKATEIYISQQPGARDFIHDIEREGYNFAEVASTFLFELNRVIDFDLAYERLLETYPKIKGLATKDAFRALVVFAGTASQPQAMNFAALLGRLKAMLDIEHADKTDQLDKAITGNLNPNRPASRQLLFVDLASGTNPAVYFRNLSAGRKYIFVDNNIFVTEYLKQARHMLGADNSVEILLQDIFNLRFEPNSVGTLRLKNVGTYVDAARISDEWYMQLREWMAPGGQIIIEFRPNIEAGEQNNPIIRKLREIFRVEEEGGWDFKWGHYKGEEFVENEPGSEMLLGPYSIELYSINTVVIFTKPMHSANEPGAAQEPTRDLPLESI